MLGKHNFKPINVVSNHFKINFAPSTTFDEYSMSFFHKKDKKQVNQSTAVLQQSVPSDSSRLISEIVAANKALLGKELGDFFFHGLSFFAVSSKKAKKEFLFECHPHHLLKLDRKHKELTPADLEKTDDKILRNNLTRFLNSFIKSTLKKLNYGTWGRQLRYYHMSNYSYLENHNLFVYQGYLSSIGVYESGLRMMIDYSTRIIRDNDMWTEFKDSENFSLPEEHQKEFFVGKTVVANYGNYRMYKIHDVAFKKNLLSPFPNKEFKNYAEYFKKRYPTIKDFYYKKQFLLVHKRRLPDRNEQGEVQYEKVYLVPELLSPTGLTDEMRGDFKLMKEVATNTSIRPSKRFGHYEDLINKINKETKKHSISLTVESKTNTLKAYKLNPPCIMNKKGSNTIKGDQIRVKDIVKSKAIANWVFIVCGYDKKAATIVIDGLAKAASTSKIPLKSPVIISITKNTFKEEMAKKLKQHKCEKPSIVFMLIRRSDSKTLYKRFKRFFTRRGIPTQFMVKFNPRRDNPFSMYMSIVNQMVVKLGGNLWDVKMDLPDTLVGGADVFHGPKGNSVASLVVQGGRRFDEFYSTPKIQKKGVELVKNMATLVLDAVDHFYKKHKKLAKNFVFFRDGVGEGQLNQVMKFEVERIVEGLQERYEKKAPNLLFVVVTKRIDDRFGVLKKESIENPEGGLLVMDDVVKKDKANFYLVAQKVTQGTATPTHYEVVFNNTDIKMEKLIEMAYGFTFGYSNWGGAVKVPAPVQYAHKQAALHGVMQDDMVNEKLKGMRHYM